MSKMDEVIIVSPRTDVFAKETLTFQGLLEDQFKVDVIMNNIAQHYTTMRRGDAENDPTFKQPIPYCVIRRGTDIFLYKRLSGGGETRLHDKLSIGAGGHMNDIPELATFEEILAENLMRELEEELKISSDVMDINTVGFINDDEDEVGKVHIGLLVVLDVEADATVSVRETDQLQGEWVSAHSLLSENIYPKLESWSQIIAKVLA